VEIRRGRKHLHNYNQKDRNSHSSLYIIRANKSRKMRRTGHVKRMREMRNVYTVLVREPERERPVTKRVSRSIVACHLKAGLS
jgi:hypothetical protein